MHDNKNTNYINLLLCFKKEETLHYLHYMHSDFVASSYLKLENQIHLVATQRANVVQNQCCDDVNSIALMSYYASL